MAVDCMGTMVSAYFMNCAWSEVICNKWYKVYYVTSYLHCAGNMLNVRLASEAKPLRMSILSSALPLGK